MSSFELEEREERFAEWLACPKGKRQPATMALMADSLDVHVSQLYRWKRRANVKERVMELVDEAVGGFDRVGEVLDKVFQDALAGNTKAQELVFKYAGLLVERRQVTTTVDPEEASERTDEQIEDELAKLRAKRADQ